MDSRTFYYARVSSDSQKLDSQIDLFKSLGATDRDIVTDKASGKDMNRPGYQALKTTILRSGDTLVIARLDRLGRSKDDIKDELKYFRDNGIRSSRYISIDVLFKLTEVTGTVTCALLLLCWIEELATLLSLVLFELE